MAHEKPGKELQKFLKAYPDTQLLELLQPDMNGIFRGKRLPADEFSKLFDDGVNYCASSVVMDTKGEAFDSVYYGNRDGDPDVMSQAVEGSLVPVPWALQPTAQVLLQLNNIDGSPYFADPRTVLETALKPLTDMGLQPVVATELEFYLLEHDGEKYLPKVGTLPGSKLRQEGMQFSTLDDLAEIDPLLADIDRVCRAQNIPAGTALSEYAPGQFEINLKHVDNAVLACDHAVLLKRVVKAVAQQHKLAASFMAKPFTDYSGCGLHIHISLLDENGNNVFAGSSADGEFSDTLRHAIGGMAETMAESMAIFAPNANSYRRYGRNSYVPIAPNWGPNHRDLALRIPLSSPENTRVEHRVAGADANPYLAMAAVLAGIHYGISNKCDPGVMVQAGQEIDEEVKLPIRWELALDAFAAGKILPKYLGETYHELFEKCRREECDRFHAEVSERDYEWYLRAV
jgi:glutamine synthetase